MLLTKLNILSSQYNTEIGGYLIGEVKNGEINLQDILIPEQRVTSASVTIDSRDQIQLLKKYGTEKCRRIIGHWHSHAKMGCFWSGQDMFNMNNIMSYKDYFVFIVSSNEDHKCRICISKPIRIAAEDVPLELKSLSIDLFKNHVDKILNDKRNLSNKQSVLSEDWTSIKEDDKPEDILDEKEMDEKSSDDGWEDNDDKDSKDDLQEFDNKNDRGYLG